MDKVKDGWAISAAQAANEIVSKPVDGCPSFLEVRS